jgi:hypothetical protein
MSTRTSATSGQRFPPPPTGKGKGGKKGRKPVAPVRVGKDRNWGPIILFVVVGLFAAGIIGFAAWSVVSQDSREWHEQAADIEGIVNYRETQPEILTSAHESGPLTYTVNPPVGGNHNGTWQNCQGNVYPEPIPSEHAVHSMEHGAVWVTYDAALPADQVEQLASRVRGTDYALMSPYEGLDAPISLQAWGYQLKVDNASDERIDEFIRLLRVNAGIETATCGNGLTVTGTVPVG